MSSGPRDTRESEYAQRLVTLERRRWKRLLDVQRPYRWNLRRLGMGRTLDIGCGIGRNLVNLDGNGVGVDHNADSIRVARDRGLVAYLPEEFLGLDGPERLGFDSLLLSHVAEHMEAAEVTALVKEYLPSVRAGGRMVVITPQEAGFRTDASHVRFVGFEEIEELCTSVGATVLRRQSFPFPRRAGRFFPYNEFVVSAQLA
jgi:SAM-dependent methyltransferase